MENPYQSPGAVVEDREKPSSSLGDVASGQKLVIYAILLYFLAAALRTAVGPIAALAFLACLVMSWVGIYKIARGLDYPIWWRIVLLVLMGNDSANMEFTHFNRLAERFGLKFNFDDYHKVTGNQYEMGAFTMTVQDAIFPTTHKFYIKELSTLQLSGPAKAHFSDKGNVIIATAKVGRGTVFAVGDPWFYNEYTDGRKLPAEFENFSAARDATQWLIKQTYTK